MKNWVNGQTGSKTERQQLVESKYLPDKMILTKMFISSMSSTLNSANLPTCRKKGIFLEVLFGVSAKLSTKIFSCYCFTVYKLCHLPHGVMVPIMRKSYRSLFCSSNDFPYIKMECIYFFQFKENIADQRIGKRK